MKIGQFLRTVRYIPLRMIWARLAYMARCAWYVSPLYSFTQHAGDVPSKLALTPPALWAGNKLAAEGILDGYFTFQNTMENVGSPIDWLPEHTTPLWKFTLHYFEWLADLKAYKSRDTAQMYLEDWLLTHDHFDKVVWHPYPLSLRLVSWFTYGEWALQNAPPALKEAFMESLVRQTSHLERNIEKQLGYNHVLKNLKALIYAGLCLPGRHGLFRKNLERFMAELSQQILPDGAHVERSPSYHIQVLKDVLDVHALIIKAGHTPPHQMVEIIERMATVAAFYRHADGELCLFNDGEVSDKKHLNLVLKRCGGAGIVPEILPDAGYARLKRGDFLVFMDAGKIGPDDNPGHGHAGTLSVEIDYKDDRVFVNRGTFLYQHAKRGEFRATRAHNTVEIDGKNSAEVWGNFRVGRRPKVVSLMMTGHKNGSYKVVGSHDGYGFLGVKHTRVLSVGEDQTTLAGEDIIEAKRAHFALTHFHVHPDVSVALLSDTEVRLCLPTGKKLSLSFSKGRLMQQEYDYSPHFGQTLHAQKIMVKWKIKAGKNTLKWVLKAL